MFNKDFFPTSPDVIEIMLQGMDIAGKVVLEPSAGKGDIVDALQDKGAKEVIACELNDDLRTIVATKCRIMCNDFLSLTSERISHIDAIVMNPPFSDDETHIVHAFNIAPPGCEIRALCNSSTISNPFSKTRKELVSIIESHGKHVEIGDCFSDSERKTGVLVSLISLTKPGTNYNTEFEGFFMDEDPEEEQSNSIMSYNAVRDLVNRYVAAVKLYDSQLNNGVQMNSLIKTFYENSELVFQCTRNGVPQLRATFKKELQRGAWKWIFNKMNLEKWCTQGLREDLNKFVESQENIPFTMKNIYHMLNIVVSTTGQRMDKAILEVFDKITEHHHDNRHNVTGWKTNSHYLVGKKFILPNMCYQDQRWHKGESKIRTNSNTRSFQLMEDFVKAICFLTGENFEKYGSLEHWCRHPYKTVTDSDVFYHWSYDGYNGYQSKHDELYQKGIKHEMIHDEPIYGSWFDWAYWRVKAFKKGSMHFEFKDNKIWEAFNARVAKLKGYPLFEGKQQTAYQKRNTGRPNEKPKQKATVLSSFKINAQ
jgi:hypothetical protein